MKCNKFLIPVFFFLCSSLHAQHYTAIHGSPYFGSLGVYNNPSSIVSSPYKWDLTLLGMQYQAITNAVRGKNFPLYLAPGPAFSASEGNFPRKANFNYNIHLLNGRYSIDRFHSIAFGANLRGYAQAGTSRIDYTDAVVGPRTFLLLNEKNREIEVRAASSAWMEFYGSYGLTIFNRESGRLNAGATLKILRGMSGSFVKAENVKVDRTQTGDVDTYRITGGNARFGYSANHGDASSFSAGDLFSGSKTSFALDLGVEYVISSQAVTSVFDEHTENDYDWKIGFSLLDLGRNLFRYGAQSRSASGLKEDISSLVLQRKFSSVQNLQQANDSLATIVNQFEQLTGNFSIMNPARAVIQADRYISGNFYVNGELSVNLSGAKNSTTAIRETNLLTITPRWEFRRVGFYIPLQYLNEGGFWIGGAIRAGPLLIGTHNLLNAFSKKKDLRGGAYLALVLRPLDFIKDARNQQYECPVF